MKILYVFLDSTQSQGVISKVKSKIRFLNLAGIETEAIFLNRNIQKYEYNKTDKVVYVPLKIKPLSHFFNRRYIREFKWYFTVNRNMRSLYRELDAEVEKHKFDLILMRYPLSNKHLLSFTRKYKGKIVFEHNTKEPEELFLKSTESKGGNYVYRSELKYGPMVLSLSKGIVAVTNEIREYEIDRSKNKTKKSITVTNAIDFSSIPVRKPPAFNGKELNLLFLSGSDSPWQGEDRLIKGISEYKGNVFIKVFLIGKFSEKSKELVKELGVERNVVFLNEMTGNSLNEYFDICHLAMGTLALHRKGLKEAVSLKVRDYFARGMPVVLAYDDSDLQHNPVMAPFYLQMESSESPLEMDKIVKFASEVYSITNRETKIRELAHGKMDIASKMKELKFFLESI